jgi:hypothetical protein
MSTTISTAFDSRTLPEWAQRDAAVVERCRFDLAFRATVCTTQTRQQAEFLRRDTQRFEAERDRI